MESIFRSKRHVKLEFQSAPKSNDMPYLLWPWYLSRQLPNTSFLHLNVFKPLHMVCGVPQAIEPCIDAQNQKNQPAGNIIFNFLLNFTKITISTSPPPPPTHHPDSTNPPAHKKEAQWSYPRSLARSCIHCSSWSVPGTTLCFLTT